MENMSLMELDHLQTMIKRPLYSLYNEFLFSYTPVLTCICFGMKYTCTMLFISSLACFIFVYHVPY
jgi:hypothetical protein